MTACGACIVPELRGDPEFLALDAAAHDLLERAADLALVAVDGGAIEMPVAGGGRAQDGLGGGLMRRRGRSRRCRGRRPGFLRRASGGGELGQGQPRQWTPGSRGGGFNRHGYEVMAGTLAGANWRFQWRALTKGWIFFTDSSDVRRAAPELYFAPGDPRTLPFSRSRPAAGDGPCGDLRGLGGMRAGI